MISKMTSIGVYRCPFLNSSIMTNHIFIIWWYRSNGTFISEYDENNLTHPYIFLRVMNKASISGV